MAANNDIVQVGEKAQLYKGLEKNSDVPEPPGAESNPAFLAWERLIKPTLYHALQSVYISSDDEHTGNHDHVVQTYNGRCYLDDRTFL